MAVKKSKKPAKTAKKSVAKKTKKAAKPARTTLKSIIADNATITASPVETPTTIPDRMLRVKVKKGLFFSAPNIAVMLHQGEKLISQTMTDSHGLAFFMHLHPGDYKVSMNAPKQVSADVKIEGEMTVCSLRI